MLKPHQLQRYTAVSAFLKYSFQNGINFLLQLCHLVIVDRIYGRTEFQLQANL